MYLDVGELVGTVGGNGKLVDEVRRWMCQLMFDLVEMRLKVEVVKV